MNLLTQNWSFDPFIVVALVLACVNEVGSRRLRRRAVPARARSWRRRALAYYAGLAVLVVAVASPIDYWASRYFFVHMIQHLLLMFAAPSLVVAGAPWLPFVHALPVAWRRRAGRALLVSQSTAWLRRAGRSLLSPLVAVVAFNAAMIAWHVPALFDAAESNSSIHIWLMHGSFFVTGLLFWIQFIPSHPLRPKMSPAAQMGALLSTNVVMVLLAMALSIFSSASWYSTYNHLPGISLSPFADQQIGAAILWICGDFWCYPALVKAFRRLQDGPEGIEQALDRFLRREARLGGSSVRPGSLRTKP